MRMANGDVVRPLLRARTDDGIRWMLVFLPNDRWVITRNGKDVAVGNGDRASINRGVEKFLKLTRAATRSDAACNASVAAQLDRIEHGGSAAVKAAKSHGRFRPYPPEGSSAYLTA
jgi:hypothetical protein